MTRETEQPDPARIEDRREFWTDYQPGFRMSDEPVGSPEFFADVEAKRYALEPAIREFAPFDDCDGLRVMEGGCGIATDGINFARGGADYTGVDFSPTALELAQRRFELEGRTGNFVRASLTDLPFEDESFDIVYSNGVIHHLPETEVAANEFHRVLKPGGRAIVLVYHRTSLNYWFNIMVVRRLLAALLLIPGAASVVARVTGEDPEVLEGHKRLLSEHGVRYLLNTELFLSNNTDGPGNPLSKVYAAGDAQRLFGRFSKVETEVRWLNLRMYPKGERLGGTKLAERLGRRFGWHLWIRATK